MNGNELITIQKGNIFMEVTRIEYLNQHKQYGFKDINEIDEEQQMLIMQEKYNKLLEENKKLKTKLEDTENPKKNNKK